MDTDTNHAHCKACDKMFYPKWKGKAQGFEDLCWTCLAIAEATAKDHFVREYVGTKREGIPDCLWMEDEYLAEGEGAMGELDLLDKRY